MSKILITTMHRGNNYGSALQTYALARKLQQMGHQPIVLDYIPERIHFGKTIRGVLKSMCSTSFLNIKNGVRGLLLLNMYKRVYDSFFRCNVPLTPKQYDSYEEICNDFPERGIDVYMTGSDQVWNSIHNRGIEPVFFLKFAPDNALKVSYSASFGKSGLEEWERDTTRELLSRYQRLSVREKSGQAILRDLGLDGEVVLDPTFLLDKKDWEQVCVDNHETEKYVLIYSVEPNVQSMIRIARAIADKLGAKVYLTEYGRKCYPMVDKMLGIMDPLVLMDYFRKAEFVVASSFHGTALSLNLNKPFISVSPAAFSTRVQSILQIVGLEDRLVKAEDFDLEKAMAPIDYARVNQALDGERRKSVDYLKKCTHLS